MIIGKYDNLPPLNVYLIRHAQSEWQVGTSSSKNSGITFLGQRQAKYLKTYVKMKVEQEQSCKRIFYLSPLKRVYQTFLGCGYPYIIDFRLREAPFSVSERLPRFAIPCLYERRFSEDKDYLSFKQHLSNFLEKVISDPENLNIFLFTHGGVIKTILRLIHANDAVCYTINNCSMTLISWYRAKWHIKYLNDLSFLPKDLVT